MTATLYLNATVFPAGGTGESTTPLTVQVFLASRFLNPPNGFTAPPGTPDGSTTANPTGTIAGLNNADEYWLLCYNPQGYIHWFLVDWTSGNSSEAPLDITVPLYEGTVVGIINNAVGNFATNSTDS